MRKMILLVEMFLLVGCFSSSSGGKYWKEKTINTEGEIVERRVEKVCQLGLLSSTRLFYFTYEIDSPVMYRGYRIQFMVEEDDEHLPVVISANRIRIDLIPMLIEQNTKYSNIRFNDSIVVVE